MSILQCPNEKNRKEYILPTKSWLVPIKELINSDPKTVGRIFISELIERQQIIVKITFGRNNKLVEINESIKNMPNFVYTYCVFMCYDDLLLVDKNKQFCNESSNAKSVTLEVMRNYYEGSLSKIKNMENNTIISCIKQLINAQINVFLKFGMTHNDIHKGNILIYTHKNTNILEYEYIKKNTQYLLPSVKTNIEFILADYDKAKIFSGENLFKIFNDFDDNYDVYDDMFEEIINLPEEKLNEYSLYANLISTIYLIIRFIKSNETKIQLQNWLFEYQKINEDNIYKKYRELLINLAKKNIHNKKFRKEVVDNIESHIAIIISTIEKLLK